MCPPRLTVRRLMAAVAIVALVSAAEATRRRCDALAATYRRKADEATLLATLHEFEGLPIASGPASAPDSAAPGQAETAVAVAARHRRLARHYRELAGKYWRASRYPFLPVAPDPPAPE